MGVLKQLSEYLYLSKPDPARPKSQWVRYMHGINRITVLLFVFAMLVILFRLFFGK
jgi:hypothetical protein